MPGFAQRFARLLFLTALLRHQEHQNGQAGPQAQDGQRHQSLDQGKPRGAPGGAAGTSAARLLTNRPRAFRLAPRIGFIAWTDNWGTLESAAQVWDGRVPGTKY